MVVGGSGARMAAALGSKVDVALAAVLGVDVAVASCKIQGNKIQIY
jgi:hypothetical protein